MSHREEWPPMWREPMRNRLQKWSVERGQERVLIHCCDKRPLLFEDNGKRFYECLFCGRQSNLCAFRDDAVKDWNSLFDK